MEHSRKFSANQISAVSVTRRDESISGSFQGGLIRIVHVYFTHDRLTVYRVM